MTRRVQVAVVLIGVPFLVALILRWYEVTTAPSFEGESVYRWIDAGSRGQKVEAAARGMGTNSFPYVVERITDDFGVVRKTLREWLDKAKVNPSLLLRPALLENSAAEWFCNVGIDAVPLVLSYTEHRSEQVRLSAMVALQEMAVARQLPLDFAEPVLLKNLEHPSRSIRWMALGALEKIPNLSSNAVPYFRILLRTDQNLGIQGQIVHILRKMGPNALAAADELKSLQSSRNLNLRCSAGMAYWYVTSDSTYIAKLLCDAYEDVETDDNGKSVVLTHLWTLGIDGKSAIPFLQKELSKAQGEKLRGHIQRTLSRLEVAAKFHADAGQ